jgi:hypothetical protein
MKLLLINFQILFFFFSASIENFSQNLSDEVEEQLGIATFGIENDFVTRYIWQGLNCNQGAIHQPTLWLTHSNFTFYSWANLIQHDVDGNMNCNEVDFAALYSKQLNSICLETSLAYIYIFHENAPSTIEAFLKLSYELFETELYSDVTLDVMEYSGSLSGNFGVTKNIYSTDELSISTGINVGWANNKFNENYIGVLENIRLFNYSSLFLEANYYLTDFLYIRPHIEYCYLFSPVFKSISGNSLTNFGIAAGVEF